jgi:glycosyltransferase involved in cell wall biosynthesis
MDALPTVLLEALAMDLPIVSTRLAGVPEIVGAEAGLLVEPGNDEELAAAIRCLWGRIRCGEQPAGSARARGERLFDLRANVSTLGALFRRSAGRSLVA